MSLTYSYSDFYNVTALEQFAINLFYMWGYNFYKLENQLRADDLTVRRQCGLLLSFSKASVDQALADYRSQYLPEPTRERPRPDPEAVKSSTALAKISALISTTEGMIRSAPAPANDRMTQRYRQEAETLSNLITIDTTLIGQAETLRQIVDKKDATWILANAVLIQQGLTAIDDTMKQRQMMLI